jgi:hypothetical protein
MVFGLWFLAFVIRSVGSKMWLHAKIPSPQDQRPKTQSQKAKANPPDSDNFLKIA